MNGGQIRTWLMLAACVVVYTGATSAGKHIVSGSDMRRDYANSMNVDPDTLQPRDTGEAYFAAGPANRDFVVAVEPPDQTTCDAFMAYMAQEQTFLAELNARGFQNIGCVRYQDGNATWQTRRIVPKPAPAVPPVSPEPRAVPHVHSATTSEASA